MCFHYLPNEQVVFRNEAIVGQAALKIRIALLYQWGAHMSARGGREPERFEFVHLCAGAVADADHLVHQIGGWHVDHAFLAAADHLEAVVALEMQQATSDGENSNTMCQPMVMMLVFPFHAEVTSTTGPGSK
jgi:hypothetical protein